jgi:hypothetical protein
MLIVGVGGAGEIELAGGAIHAGANVFVEWEAVEGWLELELGASVLAANGDVEAPLELLIKKPFRLARGVEFMTGIGPEIVHVFGGGTFVGAQVAFDFMFWPSARVGLWVEPTYDCIVRDGISQGLGSTGGLLVRW